MLNYSFSENRVIYEVMWENVADRYRPQLRNMRITCWITKASDTHCEYVILLLFTRRIVPRTQLNITFIPTLHVLFGILFFLEF